MSSVPASRSSRKLATLAVRHCQIAQPPQHQQRDNNKDPERRPNPQIFAQQNHQHPDQQEAVAEQLHHQLREKARQRVDVAVNALDHFARRMLLMKREIQAQTVPGQVAAQRIGRPPPYILRQDSAAHRRDLLDRGNADEQQRQARKERHRIPGQRRIQKTTHDQGVDQLQENIDAEDQQKKQRLPQLRAQIAHEQTPIYL